MIPENFGSLSPVYFNVYRHKYSQPIQAVGDNHFERKIRVLFSLHSQSPTNE